jgi:hypothetical protein
VYNYKDFLLIIRITCACIGKVISELSFVGLILHQLAEGVLFLNKKLEIPCRLYVPNSVKI